MTDKERRTSKYLPFDALKGLKKKISECDDCVFMAEMPMLSDEQKDEMDYIIFNCYTFNKIINIIYYENGFINSFKGVINKIDYINKKIILLPKKSFDINFIVDVFPNE